MRASLSLHLRDEAPEEALDDAVDGAEQDAALACTHSPIQHPRSLHPLPDSASPVGNFITTSTWWNGVAQQGSFLDERVRVINYMGYILMHHNG